MRSKSLTLGLFLTLLAAPVAAQSYWMDAGNDQFSFEVLRPMLAEDELTTTSLALFAAGTFTVRENLAVAFDLPFVRVRHDITEGESSSSIGNPYVGVEWGLPQFGLQVTGGARLPVAQFEFDRLLGQAFGVLSTVDRMEAFTPETAALLTSAHLTRSLAPAVHVSARLGMNMALYTEAEDGDDSSDLFTLYGAQGWYETGAVRVGGGFLGRLLLTGEEGSSFGDNSLHEAGLWLDYAVGPTRTGINLRMPLDDQMSDIMDFTVGLIVSYRVPR